MIREAELPNAERPWDFYVMIAGVVASVTDASANGRKYLAVRENALRVVGADGVASG